MTETFAAGMTALLGSVIRPVKDAFDDCAYTATGQNANIAVNAMALIDAQLHLGLRQQDAMKPAHYLPGRALPESSASLALLHISIRAVKTTAKRCFGLARLSALQNRSFHIWVRQCDSFRGVELGLVSKVVRIVGSMVTEANRTLCNYRLVAWLP